MKKLSFIICNLLLMVSCNQPEKKDPPTITEPAPDITRTYSIPDSILVEKARLILSAIANNEDHFLLTHFEDSTTVRFSPYAYVDTVHDQELNAAEIRSLLISKKTVNWGSHAGSGDPIMKTFREYAHKYIYDTNFLDSSTITIDSLRSSGSMIENAKQIYPNARIIEFYRKGTSKYSGMDWRSLKIVFKEKKAMLYPIAFIHNEWTP